MLYNLLFPFTEYVNIFNLFQYITVRAGGALFTAFFLSLIVGPWVIRTFKRMQNKGKTVRTDHPEGSVNAKQGTPTMGGALIVFTLLISTLLWADLMSPYTWLLVTVVSAFGFVGLVDDYLNLTGKWKKGLPGRVRLAIQSVVSFAVLYLAVTVYGGADATSVYMPFFKNVVFDLGLLGFLLFGTFVIVGSANSVNLTDGLDGLVSVPAAVVAGTLAALAYISGRVDFTAYLEIPYIFGAGEIAVFCAALAGSMLGFLWFNAPPARIFMGDTGSLAVGGALGAVAVLIKQEFVFAVVGGLFVLETVSVIIQVTSFKTTGKRVFRMAPLHHHFEHKGWPEPTIVVRFWIISILLAMIGLATLKLR